MPPTQNADFRPTLTRTESKADSVSRIAMSMIEEETARREAKTARLREARLAQEASPSEAAPAPETTPPARPRLRKAR